MVIDNHILVGAQFKQTPNIFGLPLTRPKYLIIHYTASGTTAGTVAHLTKAESNVSAHIVIGRDGDVVQLASFDQRCKHCGESAWGFDTHLNFSSIGIELVNWGPVEKDKDGVFRSAYNHVIPADEVEEATHKNESEPRYWQKYTDAQLAKGAEIARAILQAYPSIEMILGHDDISPGRKSDPGPLFPMNQFLIDCGFMDAPEPAPGYAEYMARAMHFEHIDGEVYVTLSDSEGGITEHIDDDEARGLRDWLTKILPNG